MRRLAILALVALAGVACSGSPPAPAGAPTSAALQLSPAAASPGTAVRVQGTGFRVAEYVELRITDPAGFQATLGRVIADEHGDIQADLAPDRDVHNGVCVISASGTVSDRAAAAQIEVTGGSDQNPAAVQPHWTMSTSDAGTCAQCLLVHGQAP